jgi:hypothetical protein
MLPPAAKTLFEKRVLDSQKLFINRYCILLLILHDAPQVTLVKVLRVSPGGELLIGSPRRGAKAPPLIFL